MGRTVSTSCLYHSCHILGKCFTRGIIACCNGEAGVAPATNGDQNLGTIDERVTGRRHASEEGPLGGGVGVQELVGSYKGQDYMGNRLYQLLICWDDIVLSTKRDASVDMVE